MKYAIFGDLHGKDLGDLEKALNFENPNVLICTGDFDQTKTIHQFIKLEEKYQREGKKVIKVSGNHDHAIMIDLEINSGTLRIQNKSIHQLHQELISDPIAHKYISELVDPVNSRHSNNQARIFLDEDKFGKEYPTTIIHGAYDGDLSSFFGCTKGMVDFWMRLRTEEDYEKNFKEMDKKNCKVMIRGHDHSSVYVYNDPVNGIIVHIPEINGDTYSLFRQGKHVINPGALFEGSFATIDTGVLGEENPILKYHKL